MVIKLADFIMLSCPFGLLVVPAITWSVNGSPRPPLARPDRTMRRDPETTSFTSGLSLSDGTI